MAAPLPANSRTNHRRAKPATKAMHRKMKKNVRPLPISPEIPTYHPIRAMVCPATIRAEGKDFRSRFTSRSHSSCLASSRGEGDLHHLRRADAEGEKGKFQPCGVARVVRDAKGCQQQGDEHDVEGHKPLPPPHQPLQVQHGHEDIGADAQHHGRPLDAHISHDAADVQIPGGAGDQRHAVQGWRRSRAPAAPGRPAG